MPALAVSAGAMFRCRGECVILFTLLWEPKRKPSILGVLSILCDDDASVARDE